MHWQKTGQDNLTSAVVRYQLWFGAGPLRLIFSLTCNFHSQFKLVGRAGPATNSPYFANAKRCRQFMRTILYILIGIITITACNDRKSLESLPKNSLTLNKNSIDSIEKSPNVSDLDTIRHIDSSYINGQQMIAYCTNNYLFYVLNEKGDTVFKAPDLSPDFKFADFNNDSFEDIRIYYMTNVPDIQDLLLYDRNTGMFRLVENFTDYPSPEPIKGTKYYYSYHRSGCADMNWDSDLFYINNFKTVRIGNISGRECGNSGIKDGIYISKIEDEKERLLATSPIKIIDQYKEYKWGFIKSYWTKNYRKFL